MGGDISEQDGVAVGRRLGDVFGGNRAVGAGLVFDDDRTFHALTELLRDDARHHVVAARGRRRHDDANRFAFGRESLGESAA